MRDYALPAGDAEVFKSNVELGNYFETVLSSAGDKKKVGKSVANWVINNLQAAISYRNTMAYAMADGDPERFTPTSLVNLKFRPESLLELIGLVEGKTISSSAAQTVFAEMFETGKAPAAIVQEKGLAQVSDTGAIEKFCDEAIAANPAPVADYKAGKVAALNSLKGQVMKLSKGKANPALVGEILERKLKS